MNQSGKNQPGLNPYERLLKVMEGSFLIKNMKAEEQEEIKAQYKNADESTIIQAIANIEIADSNNKEAQVKRDEEAKKAADELKLLNYEGERLLKKAEMPSDEVQKKEDKDEMVRIENQLKQI